ncbi:glycosyltransferase family 39 protein [Falsiroseomonas sp. E2-1-a20]|uniref:glycosyltransferase family 39 protein n=1 Tax=Falsiroseomonas sp. E2-1-a20 TaxID=3239300 RepID=UPI003F35EE42
MLAAPQPLPGGALRRVLAHPLGAPLLVFLLAFLLLLAGALRMPPREFNFFDQSFYATTAWELLEYGVYGDGVFDSTDGKLGAPLPGMWLPPAFPLLLAGLMALDPALRAAGACLVQIYPAVGCQPYLGPVVPVQMALVAVALACLFAAARRLSGPAIAAVTTCVAMLLIWRYVPLLRLAMTEPLALALFAGALLALLAALDGDRRAAILLGLLLGLLVLTRPSHIVLLPLAGVALLFAPARRARRLVAPALLALGLAVALLPWAMRNESTLGRFALSGGYGGAILTERLAWNDMTWREFAASFVYNLPDAGDGWAKALFGAEDVRRLDWNHPDSFYAVGMARRTAMLADTGGTGVGSLIRGQVLAEPAWHTLTTLSMAWRGVWIGRSLGFIVLPLAIVGLMAAWRGGRSTRLLVWTAPAFIMLAVHAAASVNQERYNLALVLPISLCAALGLRAAWDRWGRRHHPARLGASKGS